MTAPQLDGETGGWRARVRMGRGGWFGGGSGRARPPVRVGMGAKQAKLGRDLPQLDHVDGTQPRRRDGRVARSGQDGSGRTACGGSDGRGATVAAGWGGGGVGGNRVVRRDSWGGGSLNLRFFK